MQRVGAYEVLYELKSGGMGSVLLARRKGPGRFEKLVAIKTIRAELAAAPQARAMFLDEAAILAKLAHPAVATVHDFGEEGQSLYLVMEYVAGVSLHTLMHLEPPPAVAARIVAEAARGLHAAHELRDLHGGLLGVVHRDVSPDNVLVAFDGRVKVIDFGIALVKGRQAPVTELGMLKGKPPYMSPEQIKNEPIDRRSDVFSLGVVLWELLVGERLFGGDSIYAIARSVEHQPIEPPSLRVPGLPAGLDEVVLGALRREPGSRTASAAVLADELLRVISRAGGETLEAWAHRVLAPQREGHQRWLAAVVGGGVAPSPMGRATGAVTAMALPSPGPSPSESAQDEEPISLHQRIARAEPPLVAEAAQVPPSIATRAGGEVTELRRPPARGRWAAVLVVMLALAASVVLLALQRREGAVVTPDARAAPIAIVSAADAPRRGEPDAPPPDGVQAPDAAVLDVPTARDARERRDRRRLDARERPSQPDAATALAPVADARSPEQAPGKLRVLAEPYANVLIDDEPVGPTPLLGRTLPAGRHVVTLVDPVTGAVRLRRTIEVLPGKVVSVSP